MAAFLPYNTFRLAFVSDSRRRPRFTAHGSGAKSMFVACATSFRDSAVMIFHGRSVSTVA